MPYGGTTKEQDSKIESCVSRLKGKYPKERAIRICKAAQLKKGS